tara:strand:- start:1049 stop:2194 length:1146 start_codon:yes stop_codon:yes gene_type:complete
MIAQLITRLSMGGAQEIVLRISKDLNKHQIQNIIITGKSNKKSLSAPNNTLLEEAIEGRLNLDIVNHLSDRINLFKDFLALVNIYRSFKRYKPKIVHIHSSKTGLLGRVLKFFFRNTHFIYHVHGWSFSRYKGIRKKVFFYIEYFLYYFTDSYIFVCNFDLDQFIELGGPKSIKQKSKVIYPGVDFLSLKEITQSRENIRKLYKIKNDEYLIGNVARLDHQKDPFLFINMAAKLKEISSHKKLKFMWIGSGNLMSECISLVEEMGLEDNFIFTGYIEDVSAYFSIFDHFVISSAYEGLPVTAIKALGSGVPLNSVGINGINDLNIYKGVNLTYNRNPVDLAKSVNTSILEDLSHDDFDNIRIIFSNHSMLNSLRKNYEQKF